MEQQVHGGHGAIFADGIICFQRLDGRSVILEDPTLQVQVAVAEVEVVIATGGDEEPQRSTALRTRRGADAHQGVIDDAYL